MAKLVGVALKAAQKKAAREAALRQPEQTVAQRMAKEMAPTILITPVRGAKNTNADDAFLVRPADVHHTGGEFDLRVCRFLSVHPQVRALLPTNCRITFPEYLCGIIFPTPHLLHHHGLVLAPQEIESGKEVILSVFNPTRRGVQLGEGDVIGKVVFFRVANLKIEVLGKDDEGEAPELPADPEEPELEIEHEGPVGYEGEGGSDDGDEA